MTTNRKIRVGIAGFKGRVGSLLVRELQSGSWSDLALAGGSTSSSATSTDFPVTDDAATLFDWSDVVIDFTAPDSSVRYAALAAETGKALLIGTTGLDAVQKAIVESSSKNAPILLAANTSIGVVLLQKLVEQAALTLGSGWDIQISETHHRHKKDAPSGTALLLGAAAGDRSIGYASQRGGDVVGEHAVTFYGAGERVALTHIATDRALFARGALHAAVWLARQPNGLYTMRDTIAADLPAT